MDPYDQTMFECFRFVKRTGKKYTVPVGRFEGMYLLIFS